MESQFYIIRSLILKRGWNVCLLRRKFKEQRKTKRQFPSLRWSTVEQNWERSYLKDWSTLLIRIFNHIPALTLFYGFTLGIVQHELTVTLFARGQTKITNGTAFGESTVYQQRLGAMRVKTQHLILDYRFEFSKAEFYVFFKTLWKTSLSYFPKPLNNAICLLIRLGLVA